MNANDKLASARLLAVNRMPYFRTAILSLIPRQMPGLGTFGVTRTGVLLWDPHAVGEWTVREIAGTLVHEAMHLIRNHADRRERMGADPEGYNIAGDLEINDDIDAAQLELPKWVVRPSLFKLEDGLTAEEYYHEIMKQAAKAQKQKGQQGSGDGQEDNGVAQALGIEPQVGSGKCGSCAGNPLPEEGDLPEDTPQRSEVELERIRRQTAEAINREAERGRGTVPGGLARWADGYIKPPKVSWQQKLQRNVRGAIAYRPGAVDLRWNWPSRRQGGVGYGVGKPVLPALRAPVPRVAVVTDTSGSMGEEELKEGLSECHGILKAVGAQVDFIACDAAIQAAKKVRTWQEAAKLLKGGGGTDFVPIFEHLSLQRPRPDVVVIITDGMGPAPVEEPPYKVIWLLVGPYKQRPCEWGECIEIDRKEEAA